MKSVTEAWLIKASEDLDAIHALRGEPHLTGVVAFHAQQCVEKCLKAVAEERKGILLRVHDLRRLWEVVADQFEEVLDVDLFRELTDVYTDSRYPGDLGLTPVGRPTEADAERFEQFAHQVYVTVSSFLSQPSKRE
jgi:HEPN domain-containing protein